MSLNPLISFVKLNHQMIKPFLLGHSFEIAGKLFNVCYELLQELEVLGFELLVLELVHHLQHVRIKVLLLFLLFVLWFGPHLDFSLLGGFGLKILNDVLAGPVVGLVLDLWFVSFLRVVLRSMAIVGCISL